MQLRVSTRLWLVFGTIFFLILLSALVVQHRLNQSDALADQTSEQSMPMALLAADMKLQAVQVQQYLSDVSATHNPGGYKEAKEAADAFHAHADAFKSKFAQERNAEAMEKLAAAVKAFDAMYALGRTMAETYVAQGIEAGNVLMETFDAATESLTDSLDPFIEEQMNEAATNLDLLKASLVASQMLQWLLAGISIAFGSLCAFFVIRSLRLQLGAEPADVADVAQKIASGDLEVDLNLRNGRTYCGVFAAMCEMRDRLKDNFAQLEARQAEAQQQAETARMATAEANESKALAEKARAQGMMQAAQQLEAVVDTVSSVSANLSTHISQSSRGADDQSGRVRETATAMEEMNATVLEVARNAQQAADVSHQAHQQAQEGSKIVTDAVKSIEAVHAQSIAIKEDMDVLGKQAEGIGQIMGVIADIADQTNLLALNAAIEAARAGDAGRGFAVVADEVRKLAEKTMIATQEVGQAITGIQEGTRKNIRNVEQSGVSIEEAAKLSAQSGESLKQILEFVHMVNDQVQSIATASEQQSAASEEINHSVEQVATISVETAQAMEQASSAVAELAQQSQALQRLIVEMKNG